jgi:hypothetical protein
MSYTKEDIKYYMKNHILYDILKNEVNKTLLKDDITKFEDILNNYDSEIYENKRSSYTVDSIITYLEKSENKDNKYNDGTNTYEINYDDLDMLKVFKTVIDSIYIVGSTHTHKIIYQYLEYDIDEKGTEFQNNYKERKKHIKKNNEYINDNKNIVKEQHEKLKNNKYIYYLITLFIIIILSIIVYIKQEFIIYYIVLFLLLNIIFKWLLIEHFQDKYDFYKEAYIYMKMEKDKSEKRASDKLINRLELGIKKEDKKYKNNKSELYNEYYKNRDLISIYGLDIITIKSLINLVMMITIILVLYSYMTKYINKKMKINIDKNTEYMILGVLISLVILVYMFDINYPIRTMSKNRYW